MEEEEEGVGLLALSWDLVVYFTTQGGVSLNLRPGQGGILSGIVLDVQMRDCGNDWRRFA